MLNWLHYALYNCIREQTPQGCKVHFWTLGTKTITPSITWDDLLGPVQTRLEYPEKPQFIGFSRYSSHCPARDILPPTCPKPLCHASGGGGASPEPGIVLWEQSGKEWGNGRHNRTGTPVMCLTKGYDKGMHSRQPNLPPQSSLRITSRCTRRKLPLSISPSGVGPYESTASQHGQPPIQDSTCCYEERRTEATDEPGVFRVNRRAESLPRAWKTGCGE